MVKHTIIQLLTLLHWCWVQTRSNLSTVYKKKHQNTKLQSHNKWNIKYDLYEYSESNFCPVIPENSSQILRKLPNLNFPSLKAWQVAQEVNVNNSFIIPWKWGCSQMWIGRDVPLAARNSYPCSGVIFSKIGTHV